MRYFQKVLNSLQSHGVAGTLAVALKRPLKSTALIRERLQGRSGLEIGGPSSFFRTFLPIYDCVGSLNNCVFASTTIWEGDVKAPFVFHPSKHPGQNYIAEGSDLGQFTNCSYDFVLSCHNLEHIANPIKALREWNRVLKPNGSLVLVVPDGRKTFDWRRRPTSVDHMLADYENDVGEDDQTHVDEILAKHDLRKDPSAGSWENFRQRSLNNLTFRSLHHHVFHPKNTHELLGAVEFKVEVLETALPFHISVLASRSLR